VSHLQIKLVNPKKGCRVAENLRGVGVEKWVFRGGVLLLYRYKGVKSLIINGGLLPFWYLLLPFW
jgi:hypothetical protein